MLTRDERDPTNNVRVGTIIEADTEIRPPFALEAFPDAEKDVVQSLARIAASPFVPHKDQVRGFVYDVRFVLAFTGEARLAGCHPRWLPRRRGRLTASGRQ